MDYLHTSTIPGNETSYLNENDSTIPQIVPLSLTSAIFLSTHPKSNSSHSYNSTDQRGEFQFYIIGIYSFFAAVFGFGIIVMLFKKLQKACCTSPKAECQDYESVPYREDLSPEDNLAFEQMSPTILDMNGRINGTQPDYENYSDISNEEMDYPKDRPPAYEDPPSYSVVP